MRRILAPVLLAGLLTLVPAAMGGAVAAPAHTGAPQAVTSKSCPKPQPYPPPPAATVEVNTTVPHVGDSLDISGVHYCPDETVDLTIAGQHVATGYTDSTGAFDPKVITPGPPGTKRVCGIGASNLPTDRDCLQIHVRGRATGGAGAGPPGGGTAFTGVQIALLGLAALVLVVGGVVVATLGRARRPEGA